MKLIIRVALLFASLSGQMAFAEDYWWGYKDGRYPSADAACNAHLQFMRDNHGSGYVSYRVQLNPQGTSGQCTLLNVNGASMGSTNIGRSGSSCPAGHTFNMTTGGCDAPEPSVCESKAGTSFSFTRTGMAGDGYMYLTPDRKYSAPAQDGCFDSCVASTADQRCKTTVGGAYACGGTAYYSGQQCAANTPPIDFTPDAKAPEPTTTESSQPCRYETAPDGTQRCESSRTVEREGQQCGEVNGKRVCPERQPVSSGVSVETTVETETHPDGSRTVTKTDVATHQSCVGAGACSSSSTTTTTTINQDAAGNTTGQSGQCTGAACPDSSNPDVDGDGFGDCMTSECSGPGGGPELGDVPSFADSLTDYRARLSNAPLISAVGNIRMGSGAGCSLPTSANTIVGSVSMQSMCDNSSWLDPLYGIFLAIHALAAVRVLLSA